MRRPAGLHVIVALVLLLPAAAAQAETIALLRGFSATGFDAMGVAPFDPSLGTLDSVDVHISGILNVAGLLPALGVIVGGPIVPVPYNYTIDVTQLFFGIGGYFAFDSPATFQFSGLATGVETPLALTTSYSYSFTFNAATELLGGMALFNPTTTLGALIPPVNGARATLDDFTNTMAPIHEVDLVQQLSTITSTGVLPLIHLVETAGTLELRYNYTPAAQPVPEPASLLLLATGAIALLTAGRRRGRPRARAPRFEDGRHRPAGV